MMSRFTSLGLVCLAVVALVSRPVAAQEKPRPEEAKRQDAELKELRDEVGRAERHARVKAALTKVAETRTDIAKARLELLKVRLDTARNLESIATGQAARLRRAGKAVAGSSLEEAEAKVIAASGRRREAEANITIGEAEQKHEFAQREVAIAEYDEARFHLQTLLERLRSRESKDPKE